MFIVLAQGTPKTLLPQYTDYAAFAGPLLAY